MDFRENRYSLDFGNGAVVDKYTLEQEKMKDRFWLALTGGKYDYPPGAFDEPPERHYADCPLNNTLTLGRMTMDLTAKGASL